MKKFVLLLIVVLFASLGAWAQSPEWTAYNDCVHGGSPANATIYSAYMGDGGGFEDPDGYLKNFVTGVDLPVWVVMTGSNISGSSSGAPASGTDAYNVFNGKVNLGDASTSYNSSSFDWYYQVEITGLDPNKTYEFVTTANRNSISYDGSGSSSRWTKFSIIGADTYTNASTTGTVQVSPDVVKMNTGYNTVNGYVIRWTGITAGPDGSFIIRSENVGTDGPGEPKKSYGMEGFYLAQTGDAGVPPPTPITTIQTPTQTSCGFYDVDVTVEDFSDVGAISLILNYDPAIFSYQSATLTAPLTEVNGAIPGTVILGYFGDPITLNDNDVLFTIHLKLLPSVSSATTDLTWSTVAGECEYAGPGGDPVYSGSFVDKTWTIPVLPVMNISTGYGFCSIQEAIDHSLTVDGNILSVYPGTYDQDEANNRNPLTGGTGTSNFNIFVNKSLTIQGVDALGNPITSASAVLANIVPKRNTPLGNLSTVFIQADDVTISGFDVTAYNDPAYNYKTISVIGENCTIKDCKLHNLDQVSCIYIYDPRYDAGTNTSYVQKYHFMDNILDPGGTYASSIRISSGPGWTGNVADRVISGNTINGGSYGIEFVGPGADPWDYYPVGAATITGNNFSNLEKGHVTAWGEYSGAPGYGAIDWAGILTSNTFDKGAIMWQPDGTTIRTWESLPKFKNVTGIYSAIQRYPINRAQAGDKIQVLAGTYTEQLNITKNLTIYGAGPSTVVKSPATLPLYFTTSSNNYPVVFINGVADCVLKDLKIDGDNKGNANYRFCGIGYWNSGGRVENVDVVKIMDATFSGAQHGVGIYAINNTPASSYVLALNSVNVTDFQKTAVALIGTGNLTIDVDDVTTTGQGPTAVTAQNGIEAVGVSGTIDDCDISQIAYTGSGWTASGMILEDGGTLDLKNVDFNTCQTSIYIYTPDGDYSYEGAISNPTGDGIILWITSAKKTTPGKGKKLMASGFDPLREARGSKAGPLKMEIINSSIVGSGTANMAGIYPYPEGGDLELTVTNSHINNWDYGICAYEDGGSVSSEIHHNDLSGNITMALWTNASAAQDATCNWWGSADYNLVWPEIEGNVTFVPYLISDDLVTPVCTGTVPPIHNLSKNTYFNTIQTAINAADPGNIIKIEVASHTEGPQIVVDRDITLLGLGKTSTTLFANGNTGTSGDARGWILVNTGVTFNMKDLTLDGNGKDIMQGVRQKGAGTIENVAFNDIKHPGYNGLAVSVFGNTTIQNCEFTQIGRVGIIFFGTECTTSQAIGITYTGKGSGDWLDYAVEIGGGAVASISNCNISGNTGVASSDGSTSAGILASTYYGTGTTATITGCTLTGNSTGIYAGYNGSDVSIVVAHHNKIYGNASYGIYSTAPLVDAENNWWGDASGPYNSPNNTCGTGNKVSSHVDFLPWWTTPTGIDGSGTLAVNNITKGTWYCKIQDAIDDPITGDNDVIVIAPGTYNENVVVNKKITLDGAGNNSDPLLNTVINGSGGIAISVTSSGTGLSDRVTLQDLYITGGTRGINVGNNASYLKFDHVSSILNSTYGIQFDNGSVSNEVLISNCKFNQNGTGSSGVGLRLGSNATLTNLDIDNSEFNNNYIGIYAGDGGTWYQTHLQLDQINITSSTFNGDALKGIYVESMSNAVFDGITVDGSGILTSSHSAGIDINLKQLYGSTGYQNITIRNSTITGCGINDPNGGGVLVKARSSYGGAKLNNVDLHNNILSNNGQPGSNYGAGIRIGEANNALTGPDTYPTNVMINNNSFTGNSKYGLRNAMNGTLVDATCNWWGTNTVAGVTAANTGNIDFDPWLVDGSDIGNPGFVPGGTCTGATELFVNDAVSDGNDIYTSAVGNDANPGTAAAPFLTIGKAVSVAMVGTTIKVDAGVFQEQVQIGKNLNIIGNDRTKTFLKAPVTMADVANPNGTGQPIIYASGAGNTIDISKITVDGDGGRNVSSFVGVHYAEANGTFTNNRITGIHDNPVFTGNQRGLAFVANHQYDVSLGQIVTVTNNLIDDYQKAGIVINELNTQGVVTGNIITGNNVANVTAQNGIQFGYGAYGVITGNTVENNIWNKVEHPHQWTAAGILLAGVGVDYTNTPTGNTTTVGGNILNGNENALSSGDGGYGYSSNQGLVINPNTFSNNKIHVWLDAASSLPNSSDTYDKRVDNPVQTDRVFGFIQYAVDEAATGNTLNASAHTFVENVVVHTPVIINGAGELNTTVIPAISSPNCGGGGGGSLCAGSSNVFLVEANDVTIRNLTVDGNNPAISSGVFSNGIDVDARNGIITNHSLGVFNNLNVNHAGIKNIYLRGIYASSGGTFDFQYNNIDNVAGEAASIGIFNFGGAGTISHNTATNCNDAIASNWSTGTTYAMNTVTNSGTGIHTDNQGSAAGSTADIIENNNISNSKTNGYGIFVFAPYKDVQVLNNTVTNCDYGFASAGQYAVVNPLVSGNTFDGGYLGAYITTEIWGYAAGNQNVTFTNNFVKNYDYGFYLFADGSKTNTTSVTDNSITDNGYGVATGGSGSITANMTCNWWGASDDATVAAAVGEVDPPVDHTPWLINGLDNSGDPGFQPVPLSCAGTPVVVTLVSKTDVSCPGSSDGAIDINVTGGSGSYTYLWTPGSYVTQDLTGIPADNYNVLVTDTYGSTGTLAVVVGTTPDNTHPVLTCPPAILAECSEPAPYADYGQFVAAGGSATDYCGVNTSSFAFVSDVKSGETCAHRYTITRTYSIKDVNNNESTCEQTITVNDVTAPSITTCPPTMNIEGCSTAAITPLGYSETPVSVTFAEFTTEGGVATDACGVTSWSYQDSKTGSCPIVVTRVWTVGDACGNTTTCNQTINIDDTQAPSITNCPPAKNFSGCSTAVITPLAYSETSVSVTLAQFTTEGGVATDACGVTTWSYKDSKTGSCPTVVTRVWTVGDACGNIITCNQTINVMDNTAPVISTCPSTENLTGCSTSVISPAYSETSVTVNASVFTGKGGAVSDNCGGTLTYSYKDSKTSTCPLVVKRVWTVKDACNNAVSCNQTININDVTNPSITCPAPISLTCPQNVGWTTDVADISEIQPCPDINKFDGSTYLWVDNGIWVYQTFHANNTGLLKSVSFGLKDIVRTGAITVTVSLYQGVPLCSANAKYPEGCALWVGTINFPAGGPNPNGIYTITIPETERPYLVASPSQWYTLTFEGIPQQDQTWMHGWWLSWPTCATVPGGNSGSYGDPMPGGGTYGYNQAGGGCDQSAHLAINTVITQIPGLVVSDNCTVKSVGYDIPSGSLFGLGTTNVNFTVKDLAGLSNSCIMPVTISDNEAPVISGCPSDISAGTDDGVCTAVVSWTEPTATDNCDGAVAYYTRSHAPGTTFTKGTTTITYEFKDAAGNISTCIFDITVTDDEAPTVQSCPSNISVGTDDGLCTAVVTYALPKFQDNCDGTDLTGTMTAGLASGSAFPKGITTVTYQYFDIQGNGPAICTFTVTVTDDEAPTVQSCPSNISVGTDDGLCTTVVTYALPKFQDNCDGTDLTGTMTAGLASGSAFPKGITTVTYQYFDIQGNGPAICTFTVTVTDDEAPTVQSCPSNISVGTDDGLCTAVVTYALPKFQDNCDGTDLTGTMTTGLASGSVFPKGITTVTYQYFDIQGNGPAICTFTVTVTDDEAPTVQSCPSNISVGTDDGLCTAVVTYALPKFQDNCDGTDLTGTMTTGLASGSAFPKGITTVTYQYFDIQGNGPAICTFTVTVTDDEVPVITCPTDQTVNMNTGCTYIGSIGNATATDNCTPSGSIVITNNAPAAFPVGLTVVTWTATDATGNFATCNQNVTVVSNILSGTLKYYNSAKTPMNNVTLTITPAPSFGPATCLTSAGGNYSFTGLCAGTYTVSVTTNNKPVGGINSTDAGATNYWFVHGGAIDHVKFLAGDVAGDDDTYPDPNYYINTTDATRIQKYFVYHTPFERTAWSYWKKGDLPILNNDNPYTIGPPSTWPIDISVSVTGNTSNFDLYGLCTGDFNGSFTPGGAKSASETVHLTYNESKKIDASQEFELPVRILNETELSAVSLIFEIPSELITVKEVYLKDSKERLDYAVNGNLLTIGWNATTPLNFSAGTELIVLKLKTTGKFTEGSSFRLTLAPDPLNELADGYANVIPDAILNTDLVINGPVGMDQQYGSNGITLINYPNPFNETTTVHYTLPVGGYVTLELFDMVGQLIKTMVNQPQTSGSYTLRVDGRNMPQGVYTAILRLQNDKDEMIKTIKFVVNR